MTTITTNTTFPPSPSPLPPSYPVSFSVNTTLLPPSWFANETQAWRDPRILSRRLLVEAGRCNTSLTFLPSAVTHVRNAVVHPFATVEFLAPSSGPHGLVHPFQDWCLWLNPCPLPHYPQNMSIINAGVGLPGNAGEFEPLLSQGKGTASVEILREDFEEKEGHPNPVPDPKYWIPSPDVQPSFVAPPGHHKLVFGAYVLDSANVTNLPHPVGSAFEARLAWNGTAPSPINNYNGIHTFDAKTFAGSNSNGQKGVLFMPGSTASSASRLFAWFASGNKIGYDEVLTLDNSIDADVFYLLRIEFLGHSGLTRLHLNNRLIRSNIPTLHNTTGNDLWHPAFGYFHGLRVSPQTLQPTTYDWLRIIQTGNVSVETTIHYAQGSVPVPSQSPSLISLSSRFPPHPAEVLFVELVADSPIAVPVLSLIDVASGNTIPATVALVPGSPNVAVLTTEAPLGYDASVSVTAGPSSVASLWGVPTSSSPLTATFSTPPPPPPPPPPPSPSPPPPPPPSSSLDIASSSPSFFTSTTGLAIFGGGGIVILLAVILIIASRIRSRSKKTSTVHPRVAYDDKGSPDWHSSTDHHSNTDHDHDSHDSSSM